MGPSLLGARHRACATRDRSRAPARTRGDCHGVRTRARASGPQLPRGGPGAMVCADVLEARAEHRRPGEPGPHGPVSLPLLSQGRRPGSPGEAPGRGTAAVPVAEHDAEHRGETVADGCCEHGGLRALRADHDRRPDPGRPRRHQRVELRDARLGPAAAVELPGARGPHSRQYARPVPARRGRGDQGRQGHAEDA